MANHGEIVSFIWGVADLIRDSFKRGHYQDVILPFTVLWRIDCVLAPTKPKVIETYNKLKGKLDNLDPQLCKASGFAFYNTSKYDFEELSASRSNSPPTWARISTASRRTCTMWSRNSTSGTPSRGSRRPTCCTR